MTLSNKNLGPDFSKETRKEMSIKVVTSDVILLMETNHLRFITLFAGFKRSKVVMLNFSIYELVSRISSIKRVSVVILG